jgi:hypothetical protein
LEEALTPFANTIENIIEENWPKGTRHRKEVRLSSVLKAVLVKASKMMEEPPAEMSWQSNKKTVMKLQIMRILVRKYLVLFRSARQYLSEIDEIMNQP